MTKISNILIASFTLMSTLISYEIQSSDNFTLSNKSSVNPYDIHYPKCKKCGKHHSPSVPCR